MTLAEIQNATAIDKNLTQLIQNINKSRKPSAKNLQPYSRIFYELSYAQGVVL